MAASSVSRAKRDAVADELHSAAIHLLRRVRRTDVESGVGPAQLSALSVLVFGGPRSLKDLAAIEQVKPPTMSNIVAHLEDAGLVLRAADPNDGRGVVLRASAKGRRLMARARTRRIAALAELLKPLSATQMSRLENAAKLIERITRGG